MLDHEDIPFIDIKRNMQELNFINTYLGGHAITLSGLKKIIYRQHIAILQEVLICEIGCGGGDNLRAIVAWCKENNIKATFIGIDINADCIGIAKVLSNDLPVEFIHSDYKDVNFQKKPGIIFSSLFCHHFTNEELVDMLQWMKTNSAAGFFINDLHRHTIAYHSIKWLSRFFSKSYLIKNDAPLSVARGFTKQEWITLLHDANITQFTIDWKWAFRWLIVSTNNHESLSVHPQSEEIPH